MAALVNLARVGHQGAREKALELARSGGTPWHVRWRHWLGDASETVLSGTIRAILPRAMDRVRQTETGFQYGIGGLSPMFFKDWDLPEVVWAEGGSITATGNSFAAPHITGIVAKILGKHPGLTLFQMKTVLRALSANMPRE